MFRIQQGEVEILIPPQKRIMRETEVVTQNKVENVTIIIKVCAPMGKAVVMSTLATVVLQTTLLWVAHDRALLQPLLQVLLLLSLMLHK